MRACVVDDEQVAHVDAGQRPVDGELVVVLAQAAGHVIDVVAGRVLLAHDGDVMVRAVHGRAHEVRGAGVHADVFLIDVLVVQAAGDEHAVRGEHEAAQLRIDGHVAHARGDERLLIRAAHALADGRDVGRRLAGPVGDAHAARQIHKRHVRARLIAQAHGRLKQQPRQRGVVRARQRVGRQQRVQPEVLRAQRHQLAIGLRELRIGHAILGVLRRVHDRIARHKRPARIVPAADARRDARHIPQERHMRHVVQVDRRALLHRAPVVRRRRHVRGEEDLLAPQARRLREHQLRIRRAVRAAALLAQDLQNIRVGRRLDRKVLAKARVPGKRRPQRARRAADACLVIQVEGGRVGPGEPAQLLGRGERALDAHANFSLFLRALTNCAQIPHQYTGNRSFCQPPWGLCPQGPRSGRQCLPDTPPPGPSLRLALWEAGRILSAGAVERCATGRGPSEARAPGGECRGAMSLCRGSRGQRPRGVVRGGGI